MKKNFYYLNSSRIREKLGFLKSAILMTVVMLLAGAMITSSLPSMAQSSKSIKGTVVDVLGEPVIGATVQIKGTNQAKMTDVYGNFSFDNVQPSTVIEISFLGMKTASVTVGNQSDVRVVMEEDVTEIENVVVVGYGKSSQKKLASSVATIKPEALIAPVSNVAQSLAGRAPGLIVTQKGGGIKSETDISIRGAGTPLFVINGIISSSRDFELLNSEDIASFSILKDAVATAVYGAQAANGVVVVTTKQGKGKTSFNFTAELMLSNPTARPDKLDSYGRALVNNDIRRMYRAQSGLADQWTAEELEKFRTGSDPYKYANTDWFGLGTNKFAPQQKYNITMQGGTEVNNYYLSIGILDEGTIFKENTYNRQRYNFRFSQSSFVKDIGLHISPSVEGYIEDTRAPLSKTASGGIDGYDFAIFSHLQNSSPMEIALNENGQLYNGKVDHPLIEMSPESGYHKRSEMRGRGQLELKWEVPWVDGLTMKGIGNFSTTYKNNKLWNRTAPSYSLVSSGGVEAPAQPMSLEKQTHRDYDWTLQYFLEYEKRFAEKHTIAFTGVYEATYGWSDDLNSSRSGYILPIDQFKFGPADGIKNSGPEVEYGSTSWIGRFKYDYDSRYIFEVTSRFDGSDRFIDGKRWGYFPGVSAAWNISDESFFQGVKDRNILNSLKLRASYGQIGLIPSVQELARFQYLPSYGYDGNGFIHDGKAYPTIWEGKIPSLELTWYQQNTTNIGIDFETLNRRLRGTVEYFYITRTNYPSSPSSTSYTDPLGIALPMINSKGEHRREGFDLALSWADNVGDFKYEVGGNITYFDELISRTWDESETDIKNPYKRKTQQLGYNRVGYENLGYYVNSEDVMFSPRRLSSSNVVAGDIKYNDFNGDGKIDGSDQIRIGKSGAKPRANYGIFANLNYKGIALNLLFQGATRRDLYLDDVMRSQDARIVYNLQTDYWKPDNTGAKYPRPQGAALGNSGHNYTTSDFWFVNAAYIRLKTASLSYDFKYKLLKDVNWLTKLNLSLSGNNLFTISQANKYGMDPENGSTNNYAYPVMRTYAISLNIGF